MKVILGLDASHDEWIERRRYGITATECAVVAGLVPTQWNSPFALYHRKTGDLDEVEPNDVMRLGTELEPYVCARFQEEHPEMTVRHPDGLLYAHPERDWQLATPDRLVYDRHSLKIEPVALLEAKTVSSWDAWQDGPPVYYRAQCLWQSDVVGVDTVHLAAVNRATGGYREYVVQRDEHDLELLRKAAAQFMRRIEEGVPPPVDESPATGQALRALHPYATDERVGVGAEVADEYRDACNAVRQAEERKRAVENQLRNTLGDAKYAIDPRGEPVATRSVHLQHDIDRTRLRRDHPDVVADYLTERLVHRITPARRPAQ